MNNVITDEQIEQLRTEAAAAGDAAQVELCNIALGKERERSGMTRASARRECERVIRDAQAQRESNAVITEHGNGFPSIGAYVADDDGDLYQVVRYVGPIHTGPSGAPNYCHAIVESADWDDVSEDDVFPAGCGLER